MFGIEILAGWQARSISLQADALNFFGDETTYAITFVVLGMGLRARAWAEMAKGASLSLFRLWVIATTNQRFYNAEPPIDEIMGSIGLLALITNLFCAYLLFKFRSGDANMRSVWLCTRNDAIANVAVICAGAGVSASQTAWPDLAVGAIIAFISLLASVSIIKQAMAELKQVPA